MSIDLKHSHKATKDSLILLLDNYGQRAYIFIREIVEPYLRKEQDRYSTIERIEELSLCWTQLESALFGLDVGRAMLEHPIEPLTTIEDRIAGWMADFHKAAWKLIKVFEKRIGNVEPNIERDNEIRAQLAIMRGGEVEPYVEPNFEPDEIKDREQVKKIRAELRLLGDGTELRHLREARLTAIEDAQKEVALLRNTNPFGLPENQEFFSRKEARDWAARNELGGEKRNLNKHMSNYLNEIKFEEDEKLDRETLNGYLRYLREKKRGP